MGGVGAASIGGPLVHRENIACLTAISLVIAAISACGGRAGQQAPLAQPSSRDVQPTSASASGEACVFSAGGVAFGLAGHVAWGFERASGTWEFGANEGPEYWPPHKVDISKTWDETGSFSAMLATFAKGGPYNGASYYNTYRCKTVPKPDAADAVREVSHESHQYYAIPHQDCLSQVYNVLTVYGTTGLPNAIGVFDFIPNRWYKHLSGFSAPGSL